MELAYIRVSTEKQNTERQSFENVIIEKVFCDKLSGKDMNRQGLNDMIDFAREGDTVHIHSFDRCSRNLKDLLEIIHTLNAKKVRIYFHKENLIFTGEDNPMNNLMVGLLGAVAEYERNLIAERVRQGVRIAHAKGHYKNSGRRFNHSPEIRQEIREKRKQGMRPVDLAKLYNVSRATIYNYLAEKVA